MRTLSGSLLLTFRELWAMRLTQGILLVSTLAWLFLSFAMNLDVVEGSLAAVRIFGLESTPSDMIKDAETGEWVRQAVSVDKFVVGINSFVFGASYFLGTLLGLFATMPLIRGFLEQGRIDLLISKPVSRNQLLSGHLFGVVLTVLVLASYLVGGVWVALSLKTGVWFPHVLMSIPLIVIMFTVMYSVILTVTVMTRSNGLALILAYGLIFISAIMAAHEQILPVLSPTAKTAFNTMYHLLPNFVEVVIIQAQLVTGEAVASWYSLISSSLFGAVIYGLGFIWFNRRDF
ncbi:MAG: ABC transporter permease subunit [Bacteroidetes Order II. Incertae sedis bacterium]|jgi:ABC-2 type transport system permease protein|nr:ABC transporter permease subunit [Bacteroidetes Order II. bacterium]MBT4602710.1 ABC transporter permease subunit [Bacteroidetes Order II. bacterium]MBT5249790.1 ABC transporter permease subunit [Bacteroidetes Order II. bacterium]MBT6201700.1 ABC transporter permease subunit [Bacteroidetes Order II. bacterium]MBT6424804.1 ABC transporter permease subunit [Bacteroidetes Order II. bacterium]